MTDSLDLARTHMKVRRCRVACSCPETILFRGDPASLRRMLLNLVLNAADAVEGRGRIEVRGVRRGDTAVLEVHDDGPGVPAEKRQAIFDVFYTTKPHGTGLGLLSVRVAAEDHGGSVEVADSDLGGACFRVTLPMAAAWGRSSASRTRNRK